EMLLMVIPPLGHGQVRTYPDEPYLSWKYNKYYDEESYNEINNLKRFMDALFHIFLFLNNQVRSHIDLYESKPAKWDEIKDKFAEIFSIKDTLEGREQLWRQKI